MKYEREFLQQKGIPHLPGDWDFRSEAQQVNWISKNYPNVFIEIFEPKIITNLKTKKMEKSGKIILANLEAKAHEYMPENKKKHFKNKCWERIMAEIENLKELPYHFTNEDYANLREEVNTGNDDFRYMINDFAYIDVQYYQSEIKYDCRFIDGTELNSDFNKNFLKKL